MDDSDYLRLLTRQAEQANDFLSNARKWERERWVCQRLLLALNVPFRQDEFSIAPQEPPDVLFREANFTPGASAEALFFPPSRLKTVLRMRGMFERFGVDHAEIGAWLAEHWKLPTSLISGIRHHHDAGTESYELLVPLLHVAEVLSNALDLGGRAENRVTRISSTACSRLGIVWDENIRPLFGRIEARSAHATSIFRHE